MARWLRSWPFATDPRFRHLGRLAGITANMLEAVPIDMGVLIDTL